MAWSGVVGLCRVCEERGLLFLGLVFVCFFFFYEFLCEVVPFHYAVIPYKARVK